MNKSTLLACAVCMTAAFAAFANPLTEYEPNLQDRCWMWGHDSGMYDKPGDPFNIPPSEKVSMADACAYMGVSNVSVVIWYLPDEGYCAQFRNLKRVAWVVDNGDLKQYRGKDILAKHLEFAFRKFETMPNLMGVEFDDYFFQPQPPPVRETLEDGSVVDVVPGPRTLKEIRRTMKRLHAYRRPIDARIIVYERDLGSEAIRPVVNEFDTVMFWTWTGANVAQLRENFARYRRLVPKKRTLLGIYMWDFGGKKPIGVETMRIQLDFALEKFRCGEIDGVIFHCTPLVNKNLPEVEMCRKWIAEHGQEQIGKRDPVRESIEQDVYESARVNRLLQSSGESVSLADYEGLTTARDGKRYWDKALSTALKERSAVRIPSGEHWFADVIRLDSNSRIEAEGRSLMRFDIDPSLPMVQNAPGATNLLLSGGVWIGPEKASVAFRFQEGERITVSELVLSNAVDFAVRAGGVAHLVMDGIRMPQGGFSGICFDGGVRTALLRNMERLGGVVAYPVKSTEGHGPPVRFEDVVFDNLKFNLTRPLPNLAELKDVALAKDCFSAFEFGVDADRVLLRDVLVRFHKDKCPLSGVMQVCPGAFNREDEPVVRNVRIENLMIRGWAPDGYVNVLKGRIEGGLNAVTPRRHGNLVHDIRCPLPIEERCPELEGNDYDWFERHESRKKLARTTDPQIVFVGDSITHGWEANDMRGNVRANFTRWFGRYGALNLGFGWDRIQNVLWRLEHGEMDGIHPKVVVVHIGTNNTSPGYVCPMTPNAPEDIARGILSVCRKVRELAPAAHIVLMKVFPRGATAGNPDQLKVDAVNAELDRQLADFKDGRITVLDLHDRLVDATGGVPLDLTCDHLHPNVRGYARWAEALKPIIAAECVDRSEKPQTFCNPLPLPELPKSVYINCGGKGLPHRQVSDPNLIRDQGRWYLYPSAGFVYESDDDGGTWVRHDNAEKVGGKLEGHGPGAVRHRGRFYYMPRTDGVLYDAECAEGPFRKLGRIDLPADVPGPADPMLFSDDDGRLYFYWGCTARGGIWGCELDAENPTRVISRPVELISFDPVGQPWERAANNPQNGWLEGAWMVKLNGRYCLTFAAGGAENETYAMGAYWSDSPLAGFKPQRCNPFFISPKGLVTGTGHGSVVQDERGQIWVSYCIRVGSRHWFERLVGMDRLHLDANGEIEPSSATSEPQFLPSSGTGAAGWRRIPVRTQSAGAADESLQTFTWLLDLPGKIDYVFENPQVVRSFRICWREDGYDPDNGVPSGPFRYRLVLRDADGRETVAFDASANAEDRLVDYREIVPTEAVAARLELQEAPHGIKAGVSDFALFGEPVPRPVPNAAQLKRIREGVEVYGIVHWGLNTYTDREWGFGDENPTDINPAKFDADQIVGACKAGGLQGLIVVAKHHDGFCLWPTKTTGHNISKSPFRDGKGDYVKEMERACRKFGLKFGVYVSPWDRNNAFYGTERYVTDVFQAQIRELLSGDYGEIFEMWFDGANGGDGYYGGAREKRKIPSGYYRYETETFAMVRKLQPNVCIFNESDLADFRFGGNERGIVDPDSRSTGGHYDGIWDNYKKWANTGLVNGTTFHPIEADFPLRPGWFYHAKERGKTKNAAYLMQRYLATVGNAATLNLGIAPNREGLLDEEDVKALKGFGDLQRLFFAHPAKDGDPFNVVVMKEDVSAGELVDAWMLMADGKELLSGHSIGIKRIRVLDNPVTADAVVVKATSSVGTSGRVALVRYLVDSELVRTVLAATTESGETDTAKWMTKIEREHKE